MDSINICAGVTGEPGSRGEDPSILELLEGNGRMMGELVRFHLDCRPKLGEERCWLSTRSSVEGESAP